MPKQCGLCGHPLPERGPVAIPSCNHVTCQGCMVTWNERSNACPTCNVTIDSYFVFCKDYDRRVQVLVPPVDASVKPSVRPQPVQVQDNRPQPVQDQGLLRAHSLGFGVLWAPPGELAPAPTKRARPAFDQSDRSVALGLLRALDEAASQQAAATPPLLTALCELERASPGAVPLREGLLATARHRAPAAALADLAAALCARAPGPPPAALADALEAALQVPGSPALGALNGAVVSLIAPAIKGTGEPVSVGPMSGALIVRELRAEAEGRAPSAEEDAALLQDSDGALPHVLMQSGALAYDRLAWRARHESTAARRAALEALRTLRGLPAAADPVTVARLEHGAAVLARAAEPGECECEWLGRLATAAAKLDDAAALRAMAGLMARSGAKDAWRRAVEQRLLALHPLDVLEAADAFAAVAGLDGLSEAAQTRLADAAVAAGRGTPSLTRVGGHFDRRVAALVLQRFMRGLPPVAAGVGGHAARMARAAVAAQEQRSAQFVAAVGSSAHRTPMSTEAEAAGVLDTMRVAWRTRVVEVPPELWMLARPRFLVPLTPPEDLAALMRVYVNKRAQGGPLAFHFGASSAVMRVRFAGSGRSLELAVSAAAALVLLAVPCSVASVAERLQGLADGTLAALQRPRLPVVIVSGGMVQGNPLLEEWCGGCGVGPYVVS